MIPADKTDERRAFLSDPWQFCEGRNVHLYVCKDRVTRGGPAVTVADKDTGRAIARGNRVRLIGVWDVSQYSDPQPCGSTVVLETKHGEWRIVE